MYAREPILTRVRLMQAVVVAVVVGLIYLRVGKKRTQVRFREYVYHAHVAVFHEIQLCAVTRLPGAENAFNIVLTNTVLNTK